MDRCAIVQAVMELIDSDSEDEEFDDLVTAVALNVLRTDRNRVPMYTETVVSRYFDFEFKRLFRLSRDTFDSLVVRFRASSFFPDTPGGRPQIDAVKTCLILLSYIGSQCSMYLLADRFDVSESSVHLCIFRVLNFLHSISEEVISWPDVQEQKRIKAGFLAKSDGKGPRDTIGCVDGCHLEINRPAESTPSYYNRKKFPSLLLQGACNDRNKFIDVFIGFPGSAHDARVLRESPLFGDATAKCSRGYLLGDSAYPLLPWLLTPYRDTESSFPVWKKKFNRHHSQQRVAIENTYGLLKQRFRRLYLVDAASIKQCCLIIMGACVLHNLCNEERDFFDELQGYHHEDVGNEEESWARTDSDSMECCENLRKTIAQQQC